MPKHQPVRNVQRGKFKWRLLIPYGKLESTLFRKAPDARSMEEEKVMSYKENSTSSKVVSNRRVRNACNKQLGSTQYSFTVTEALTMPIVTANMNWVKAQKAFSKNSLAQQINEVWFLLYMQGLMHKQQSTTNRMKEALIISSCCSCFYNKVLLGQVNISSILCHMLW